MSEPEILRRLDEARKSSTTELESDSEPDLASDSEDLEDEKYNEADIYAKTTPLETQLKEAFEQLFPHFPGSEFWRFFMEVTRQNSGPLGFEKNEPFYMAGLFEALLILLEDLNKLPTADMLIKWHDTAISKMSGFDKGLRTAPGFGSGFGLKYDANNPNTSTVTLEGLLEISEKFKKNPGLFSSHSINPSIDLKEPDATNKINKILATKKMSISIAPENREIIKEKITITLKKYETKIAELKVREAENDAKKAEKDIKLAETLRDEKLAVIAQTLQDLELIHPFEDANCRTVVMLLSIKLLLENGFTPAILTDPNKFDGLSITQLVQELKKGMDTFAYYWTKNLEERFSKLTHQETKEIPTIMIELNQMLAKEPDIALAQINWLFLKFRKGTIPFHPISEPPDKFIGNKECLDILKNLYIEKYKECRRCPDRVNSPEVLDQIAKKHIINRVPFPNGKKIPEELAEPAHLKGATPAEATPKGISLTRSSDHDV